MDGSRGILYRAHDGPAIATRGSFTSGQAQWATGFLRQTHAGFRPIEGITYLFEIIYPGNRIVVDYQGREDLVLLAALDTATGRDLDDPSGWTGPCVKRFHVTGDVECKPVDVIRRLNLDDDGNSEGVVLRFDHPKSGPQFRVKVKLEEYKRLHRLLFMTSTKTIWEALSSGSDLSELLERVPDEFNIWLRETIDSLTNQHRAIDAQARREFSVILAELGIDSDRRAFAAQATKSKYSAMLFKLLDANSINDLIWRQLKPEYARPFREQSESVA